ncbi:hypothetical protein [Brevundimonas goettingensis]|uniref:hypothetical protein n=1 Tax=Brevundimonas goettingensis TaxID=2774190 RepID=UPI001A9E5FCD|nr:hypothetical protein [Brevundimonas goettingensis]
MAKTSGHFLSWVKRDALSGRFNGAVGETTTPKGHRVVQFSKPARISETKLKAAIEARSAAK